MPAPVLVAAVAPSPSPCPVLGWSLFARPGAAAVQARDNLIRGVAARRPRRPAPTAPAPGCSAGSSAWLTPGGTVARLNRLAGAAGRPPAWPVPRLLAAKLVLPLVAGGLGLLDPQRRRRAR